MYPTEHVKAGKEAGEENAVALPSCPREISCNKSPWFLVMSKRLVRRFFAKSRAGNSVQHLGQARNPFFPDKDSY